MKTYKELTEEIVNTTGPNIAGKDIPFFDKKRKFINTEVFDVSGADFDKAKFGKAKFSRMKRFFDDISTGIGKTVHEFSKKYPKRGIIVRNEKTGSMFFLKKSIGD